MITAPASDTQNTLPGPNRLVGLFLARLLSYLLRLHHAGHTVVPADIVSMVRSANAMVAASIRYLAAGQLNAAGCPAAAQALRSTLDNLAPATSHTFAEPASPAELIEQLQTTLDTFECAEALARELACLMLCVHCLITRWQRGPRHAPSALRARSRGHGFTGSVSIARSPQTAIRVARGPPIRAPDTWPPHEPHIRLAA
ncbi:hypothetical protein [Ponticaulis sp.]|uniref:hypothetical protein n=1 Tax=Ponticaulis sp. TaxID=2020902 RepID=UPI0026188294|nr:hypothetical protein [Ponticaulis sp.]MDF1679373.1 hypothetical protein [Ponticaulis sp.]